MPAGQPDAGDLLTIVPFDPVVPLGHAGQSERQQTLPPGVRGSFFGQPVPTAMEADLHGATVPPMGTFAVLDAAKITFGADLVEDSGLTWRCLFRGKPAGELREVAPYLVELTPDAPLTRALFTHDPRLPPTMSSLHLWHRAPGIFLRARAPIDLVWRHLRRFTRIKDCAGKWYYFRFYEARTLGLHLKRSDRFAESFLLERSTRIPISVLFPGEKKSFMVRLSDARLPCLRGLAFSIGAEDREVFRDATLWSRAGKLLTRLEESYHLPDAAGTREEKQRQLMQTMRRMSDYGFKQPMQQDRMATWDFFLGPDFERRDPEGKLFAICAQTDLRSSDRFAAFSRRMRELDF